MFYSESFSSAYRMGDIISGYTEIVPVYTQTRASYEFDLSISIIPSDMFVILTPCCSIENKTVNIAPLKKLDSRFLSSDQLILDFTIINMPISKRIALGEAAFSKLPEHEKLELENAPLGYEYIDKFVYDDHSCLKTYKLEKKRSKEELISVATGKYMISFKDVVKIQSILFERHNENCAKVAELTAMARSKLRDKLTYYYSRIPDEDQPYLG